jgi:hypothetical protein
MTKVVGGAQEHNTIGTLYDMGVIAICSIWLAVTCLKDYIPKLFLVRVIMKVVRNTVEDVKFTFTTMVCFVHVVVWHYECHLAEELACSLLQYYLQLVTK